MTETVDHTNKKPDFNGPDVPLQPPPTQAQASGPVSADIINDAYFERRDNGPCGG